jgi:hypothetical protein
MRRFDPFDYEHRGSRFGASKRLPEDQHLVGRPPVEADGAGLLALGDPAQPLALLQ